MPRTVLVVEDERVVAKDLQRTLQQLGYRVPLTVASADEAIAAASSECPDLVLMDIRIRGSLDGIETATILKERFDVPVVYLTAYADPETLARAKQTEPQGYLLKPLKVDELRTTVEVALHKHETERRLRSEQRRLKREIELTERLASLGTMIASVAHEISNPLTVVSGNLSLALAELQTRSRDAGHPAWIEELVLALSQASLGSERIRKIVSDLKPLSRPPSVEREPVEIESIVRWALGSVEHETRLRARVIAAFTPVPRVWADPVRLGQVFVNLLLNAAQAIESGRPEANEIRVRTCVDAAARVVVEISDTGPGISADVLQKVFEPFFTTKKDRGGTGLGLSICRGIVQALGGEIVAESNARGASFRVVLPAAADEASHISATHARVPQSGERAAEVRRSDGTEDV
jgi:signal transduction histidine kinase